MSPPAPHDLAARMLHVNRQLGQVQDHLGDLLFHQAQATARERADFFPYLVRDLEPLT